jgi:hypothetical protein
MCVCCDVTLIMLLYTVLSVPFLAGSLVAGADSVLAFVCCDRQKVALPDMFHHISGVWIMLVCRMLLAP